MSDGFDHGTAGDGRPVLHLLRIGKTGTTALIEALRRVDGDNEFRVAYHGHDIALARIPTDEHWMFSVRDPIDRFVSAFGSRLRCGRPRYDVPHSPAEAAAFARFTHPHDLGVALSSDDRDTRSAAYRAMRSINHVSTSYWDWFGDAQTLRRRRDGCLAMLRVATLHDDAARLAARLGIPPERLVLPTSDDGAHRNPPLPHRPPDVVARSRDNLCRWYARDYEFLRLADEQFASPK